jgi:hypothetical protein
MSTPFSPKYNYFFFEGLYWGQGWHNRTLAHLLIQCLRLISLNLKKYKQWWSNHELQIANYNTYKENVLQSISLGLQRTMWGSGSSSELEYANTSMWTLSLLWMYAHLLWWCSMHHRLEYQGLSRKFLEHSGTLQFYYATQANSSWPHRLHIVALQHTHL